MAKEEVQEEDSWVVIRGGVPEVAVSYSPLFSWVRESKRGYPCLPLCHGFDRVLLGYSGV